MAWQEFGNDGEVAIRGAADFEAVWHSPTLGVDVEAKLSLGVFRSEIDFAFRGVDALSGDDEVVDEFFHRHEHALFVRKYAFGIGEIHWAVRHGIEHLAADLDGLAHFLHADLVAGVAIAFLGNGYIEIILFVAEIRAALAQVAVAAGGAEVGACHAEGDGGFLGNDADVHHAVSEDFVVIEELGDFPDGDFAFIEEGADGGIEAGRHIAHLPADAGVGGGETRSGELLAEVIDLFPLGEGVEENGHRADVHGADTDAEHVGGDAGELAAKDAKSLAARWQLPAHEFFDRTGVGDVVREGGEVVEAIRVGHELVVVHVFGDLFVAPVEEADIGICGVDDLSIQLKDEAQHAVSGWVGRPHVQHHSLADKIIRFLLIGFHGFGGFP